MGERFEGEIRAVLEFRGVTTEPEPSYDSPLWEVSFRISEGDLILVRLERGNLRLPLADLAVGIVEPNLGVVEFFGVDWRTVSADDASKQRARIGRLFEGSEWISSLDVDENITLAQRHHSTRPESDIKEEAANLARFFGLPGLPTGPASGTRKEDLRLAACVRAFLGNPQFIILERPMTSLFPGAMPALMNAVRAARSRGAGILWTTTDVSIWNDQSIQSTMKCIMFGSRMQLVSEGT